jgi:hypothetical protein
MIININLQLYTYVVIHMLFIEGTFTDYCLKSFGNASIIRKTKQTEANDVRTAH